jgi:four helix bundle protein
MEQTKRDFVQFLYRARASLLETQTQLEVARNVGFISNATFETLLAQACEVGRVLNGLIKNMHRQIMAACRPDTRRRSDDRPPDA